MNQPQGYTCSPHSEPLSHLRPCPTPLDSSRELSLGALLHVSVLLWWSISHMVIYMFQCYSLKSSHPRLLPLSPKVCSLHLCLLCCPACRIAGTIFLNFIYMCVVVVYSLSHVQLFSTPWTVAHQAPLSMGFPRQDYFSGLPFPPPGDLPDPGIKFTSALQVDSLPLSHLGSPFALQSLTNDL